MPALPESRIGFARAAIPRNRSDQVVWLLIAVGIWLRLWQLLGGASLWLDEIALARNIAQRNYLELLRPLDYAQIAPPGFLILERFFWALFHTDVSLRLVPFASSVASLFLMRAVARRIVRGVAVPLAVGAMAVGSPYILFAGQVKQYSSAVAFSLGLTLLALRLLDSGADRRRYLAAGAVGFVAVWFSSAAVLVITGLGGALTLLALQGRMPDRRRFVVFVLLPWIAGAGLASIVARMSASPATMAFMKVFWYHAFAPIPQSWRDLLWPWHRLVDLFGIPWGLRYRFATAYSALTVGGFVALWRRRRDTTLLLLCPIAVTFAVAIAHQYPFEGRLVLFLTPFLLLAIAAMIETLATWAGTRGRALALAVVVAASFAPLERALAEHPPYRLQEMGALLDWLATRRQPGDVVYVWYRAVPNVVWYGATHGLPPADVTEGGCWMTEPRNFLRDIDKLRGKPRVWIVLTGTSLPEAILLKRYAEQIGIRREERQIPASFPRFHLEAWLYDFSDSTRLASTSADQYQFPTPKSPQEEILACKTFFKE